MQICPVHLGLRWFMCFWVGFVISANRHVSKQEDLRLINFDNFHYDYKPFPIGVAHPFVDEKLYEELSSSYPGPEEFTLFREDSTGYFKKYSFSARTSRARMSRFLERNHAWREFYEYIYSLEFTNAIFDHLEANGIKVVKRRSRGLARWINLIAPRLSHTQIPFVEQLVFDLPRKLGGISSKLEFSAIPGSNGGLMPHTDSLGKVVTLVLSFPRPGEWKSEYGGGTSIVDPLDDRDYFNRYNKTLPFDSVKVVRNVEYQPNQAMLFVKTFNSWHAVMPTCGPESTWRKTLTINIMNDS